MTTSYVVQQLFNGIQLGTIYALIALGYTMVYGIIKLINFAHADIFMVGAYLAFFMTAYCAASTPLPPQLYVLQALIAAYLLLGPVLSRFPALHATESALGSATAKVRRYMSRLVVQTMLLVLLTAMITPLIYGVARLLNALPQGPLYVAGLMVYVMVMCALTGAAMEKIAYRPLRNKPRLSALITALGVSFFLENFCSLDAVFTTKYQAFPLLVQKKELLHLSGLGISISTMFVINTVVLIIMLVALWILVEKTLIGKQMRAVAFDSKTASLMGINVDRIITTTFMIGPALAGVSGILYAMNYGVLQSPFLGFWPGIKAFIAAVLGGIGSLPGAVLGAFIMGTTEVFANSINSNLGFAAAFLILIVILLIRPSGLLGKKENEKV
jgi:branched-chain amino acid transport system permease protein